MNSLGSVRKLFVVGLLCLAGVSHFLSPQLASAQQPPFQVEAELSSVTLNALKTAAFHFQSVGAVQAVEIRLPVPNGAVGVRLRPRSLTAQQTPSLTLFRGELLTATAGDFASLTMFGEPSSTRVSFEGYLHVDGIHYRIEQARVNPDGSSVLRISEVPASEIQQLLEGCGTVGELVEGSLPQRERMSRASVLRVLEIATEVDYEYVQALGGLQNANNRVLSILNAVDGLYRSQLGLTLQVTFQNGWSSSNDPYSSNDPGTLLSQFFAHWNTYFSATRQYDVAHLFTGREFASGVVGIAYNSSACHVQRYSLSRRLGLTNLEVPLAAHEIAHNLGAYHDVCGSEDRYIMCPIVVAGSTQFSPGSVSAIDTYLSGVTCLTAQGEVLGPILDPIGPRTIDESQPLVVNVNGVSQNGTGLTYLASNLPPNATFSDRTLRFTPDYSTVGGGAYTRDFAITITVRDGYGLTDQETFIVTVRNVNRPPRFETPPSALSGAVGSFISASLGGFDPDGDEIRYFPVGDLPPGLVIDSARGVLSWKPAGDQVGNFTVTLLVRDIYGSTATYALPISTSFIAGVPNLATQHIRGDMTRRGAADVLVFRPPTGMWYRAQPGESTYQAQQFGLPGDVPLVADFNGDRVSDYAVFRPSETAWYVRHSGANVVTRSQFGLVGDIPTVGDFDGDGRADLAVFRPSEDRFIYQRSEDGRSEVVARIGLPGDVPVTCDYNGNGIDDIALYRPTTRQWIDASGNGVEFGPRGGIPAPGDYNGDGRCDRAVVDWKNSRLIIETSRIPQQIEVRSIPAGAYFAPADYDGDGDIDPSSWALPSAQFFMPSAAGTFAKQLGLPGDQLPMSEEILYGMRTSAARTIQASNANNDRLMLGAAGVPEVLLVGAQNTIVQPFSSSANALLLRGDYDGDGQLDLATFDAGLWSITTAVRSYAQWWGQAGDRPVTADFDGDGKTDIAVYRPVGATIHGSEWFIIRSSDGGVDIYSWGEKEDLPLPADFDGDGYADPTVYRSDLGMWFSLNGRSGKFLDAVQWGLPGDIPRVADLDRDGRPDRIVWRPSNGTFYVRYSNNTATVQQWGLPGDVPVIFESGGATSFTVYRRGEQAVYIHPSIRIPLAGESSAAISGTVVGVAPY